MSFDAQYPLSSYYLLNVTLNISKVPGVAAFPSVRDVPSSFPMSSIWKVCWYCLRGGCGTACGYPHMLWLAVMLYPSRKHISALPAWLTYNSGLPPFFLDFKIWWIPQFFCMSFAVTIFTLHWDFPWLEIISRVNTIFVIEACNSFSYIYNMCIVCQRCLILLWNYSNQYFASRLSIRLIKAHWDYRSLLYSKCSVVLRFWACTSKIEHENIKLIRKIFQFRKNNSIQTWYIVIR